MNKHTQKELIWKVYDLAEDDTLHMTGTICKHTLFTKKKKGFGKGQPRVKVFYVQNNSFENLEFIRRV